MCKNRGRPRKCRWINFNHKSYYYKPRGIPMKELEEITLFADEVEAVRLADYEGMDQEPASALMKVSRTTFSRIINDAHHKIAIALIEGKALKINLEVPYAIKDKNEIFLNNQKTKTMQTQNNKTKVAIATDNFTTIAGHAGRCAGFIIIELENGNIINKTNVQNTFGNHPHNGPKDGEHHHHGNHQHEHHSHQGFVDAFKGCSALICQSAGRRLIQDLHKNGIEVIITLEREPERAAILYSRGELTSDDINHCHRH
jgi:predicted DNA-binding protein (UPF0251 family)/predicted Fe-Mo cluster-binding NifX family protein